MSFSLGRNPCLFGLFPSGCSPWAFSIEDQLDLSMKWTPHPSRVTSHIGRTEGTILPAENASALSRERTYRNTEDASMRPTSTLKSPKDRGHLRKYTRTNLVRVENSGGVPYWSVSGRQVEKWIWPPDVKQTGKFGVRKGLTKNSFIVETRRTEFFMFYQVRAQAWRIHWKITKQVVHKKKYAIRNTGNRWKWGGGTETVWVPFFGTRRAREMDR